MTLDPPTILALTVALAAAAALYLAVEWRSVREPSLLCWSAGFATISIGSTLALLRSSGFLMIGIWFANGLLVIAHLLFLLGVARFTQARLSRWWLLMPVVWLGMLSLPADLPWSKAMLAVQSLLVAAPTLCASSLLRPHGKSLSIGAVQLRYVLLIHGSIDLAAFKGEIIQVSLVEGAMAIMLIALSMTGSERYRREQQIARLAARDPLTALYNRRALDLRAPRLLAQVSPARPGALLLIDIDNFKPVNDLYGHIAGDRLLIALSEMIRAVVPRGALVARLGGDEFVILLHPASTEQIVDLGSRLRGQFFQFTAQTFATPTAVTLSIGANLFDQPPASLTELIEQGDTALYETKRGGRDSIRLVDRTGASSFG
jgi:diguanylate cyclase (GGDEF)-like protein